MAQTVQFTTSDGVDLVGDLSLPGPVVAGAVGVAAGGSGAVRGAAIVCHPHPQYGGDRHNTMVQALFTALPAAGIAALRFDFRRDFDDGRGEALDAIAAVDHIVASVPGVPVFATGYSFGAAIVAGLADGRVRAQSLVAPPLAMMPVVRTTDVDTLVLTPAHDQFSPPAVNESIVAEWPATSHETIPSSDHFLLGSTTVAAERTVAFLSRFLADPSD